MPLQSLPHTRRLGPEQTRENTALNGTFVQTSTGLEPDRLVGGVLSNYRLEELLGEGGMGGLYLATDLKLGRSAELLPRMGLPP